MRRRMNSEELDSLYRAVGECIWHIQYLEDVLHTYLALKIDIREPDRLDVKQAYEVLSKHRRANLGTALRTAETNGALPDELLADLRILKDERDWLVHRSMHQDGDKLYTDKGRSSVFDRLSNIKLNSTNLKVRILVVLEAFCKSHGVSIERAELMARKQIDRRAGDA